MGVWAIVGIVASIVISIAGVAFAILNQPQPPDQKNDFSPGTIDDVQGTKTNEGLVVPLVYGRVRIAGNVVWYGNLIHEATFVINDFVTQSGFRYFLDIWQAVCQGQVELLGVWVDNERVENLGVQEPIWTFLLQQWNDGYDGFQPTQFFGDGPQPPEYVNDLPGVAWCYLNSYLLGENRLTVPTINFEVERVLNNPIDFKNMATGSNPAAVIYDLMRKAKIPASKIDITSFNAAAAFWNDKGFGLNFQVDTISDIETATKKILNLLDATLPENTEGNFVIKYRDPSIPPIETLTDDDYIEFKSHRPTYDQIPNDFKATFKDETQDYTTREIGDQNQAALYLGENHVVETIDMTMFRSAKVASKRLTEIKKKRSYPSLEIDVTTHLGFSELLPGDKIEIQNSNLGIVSATFWVTEVQPADLDKNEFSFKAIQDSESLFDDIFQILGSSENVQVSYDLEAFDYIRVLELPYLPFYGFEASYAFLVNRMVGIETSFIIATSEESGSGYVDRAIANIFSQAGSLAEDYFISKTIDEEQGILYTPHVKDPQFSNLTTAQWLASNRFAIIGNEILFFREVANEGDDIRLSGIIRGRFLTPNEDHFIGNTIFLFMLGNNVVQGLSLTEFYSKSIAQFNANQFDPSLVTPILTTSIAIAKTPRPPGAVWVTRTGSTIDVLIFPNIPDQPSFGEGDPSIVFSPSPPPYSFPGEMVLEYDSTTLISISSNATFTRVGAFSLTVKHKRFNLFSTPYVISVGASDGVYK